jgi:predicted metal-binding protein
MNSTANYIKSNFVSMNFARTIRAAEAELIDEIQESCKSCKNCRTTGQSSARCADSRRAKAHGSAVGLESEEILHSSIFFDPKTLSRES